MSWKAKTGRRQQVLASIVSTLLAIAALAEKSAGDSPWVRFCVLWAAREADLIARDYVAGSTWNTAGRLWSPALPTVRYGTGSADAIALAASLRALARIVLEMKTRRRRLAVVQRASDGSHDGGWTHDLDTVVGALWHAAFPQPEICDTS